MFLFTFDWHHLIKIRKLEFICLFYWGEPHISLSPCSLAQNYSAKVAVVFAIMQQEKIQKQATLSTVCC